MSQARRAGTIAIGSMVVGGLCYASASVTVPSVETAAAVASAAAAVPNAGASLPGVPSGSTRSPDDRLAAARTLLRSGDYARVEAIARGLLAEAESPDRGGGDSLGAARAIDLLVASLVRAGKARAPETGELARRAVALKEKALGPESPDVAASVFGLAEQLRMEGAYPEARAMYERALAIREQPAGHDPDPAGLVESLRGLGTFHYKVGEYASARALDDRALALAERSLGPEHPDVALILVDVARVLRTTGNFTDGRPLLDRALAIQEKGLAPDHLETAYTLRELGELLRLSGDYAAARPAFERALAIREKALGPDHLEVADVLTGLGILLRRVGITRDHTCPEALPVCERAMTIAENFLGSDHPELARYLEGLGWAMFQCSGLPGPQFSSRAQPYFERSLAILEKAFGRDHLLSTDSLEGLGFTTKELAGYTASIPLYDSSIQWYRRKLAIERSAFGPDNVEVGFTLSQLAYVLDLRLLSMDSRIVNRPPTRQEASDRESAVRTIVDTGLEAERISREHARLTGRSLAEREALSLAGARWMGGMALALYQSTQSADPEVRRRTWDALVHSRALVLDILASRHGAVVHANDPEVDGLARVMDASRARLANLTVRGSVDVDPGRRKALDDARREKEAAERALAAKSAGFAAQLEQSDIGLDDVIASLPPSSALVAYVVHDIEPHGWMTYGAFVIRAGERFPAAVRLGSEEEVDRIVGAWRQAISKPQDGVSAETATRTAGERLRRKIWDPLVKHLGNAKRVFIVPDGALNTVSFAALPVGRNAYLVESGPILHYLSSERDLVPPKSSMPGDGLLAVGGPAYDDTSHFASMGGRSSEPATLVASAHTYRGPRSSCDNFQSMRFPPLPEAGKEATRLVALWNEAQADARGGRSAAHHIPDTENAGALGAARPLVGAEASEEAFKRLAPGLRFVHIATHGFFLGGACASALDPPAPGGLTSQGAVGENPLLLSGLALAGANHRAAAGPDEEDGILTAEEIASLDLSGVEWAVLSACDTASGDIRAGEGVLGLQRAFRVAGARTLVMSLWPVDDRATRRWMQELYDAHLRRGLDTAAAVRGAMLSVLEDRRRKGLDTHPFHWAGFIAAGDWH